MIWLPFAYQYSWNRFEKKILQKNSADCYLGMMGTMKFVDASWWSLQLAPDKCTVLSWQLQAIIQWPVGYHRVVGW
jgi:hypothetical protein